MNIHKIDCDKERKVDTHTGHKKHWWKKKVSKSTTITNWYRFNIYALNWLVLSFLSFVCCCFVWFFFCSSFLFLQFTVVLLCVCFFLKSDAHWFELFHSISCIWCVNVCVWVCVKHCVVVFFVRLFRPIDLLLFVIRLLFPIVAVACCRRQSRCRGRSRRCCVISFVTWLSPNRSLYQYLLWDCSLGLADDGDDDIVVLVLLGAFLFPTS